MLDRVCVLLVAAAVLISGCEKVSPVEEEAPAPAVVATPADIEGRWVIHSADLRDAAYNAIKAQVEARQLPVDDEEIERHVAEVADYFRENQPAYIFESDGTMRSEAGEVSYKGRWTIAGDIVTISVDGGDSERRFRFEPGYLRNIPTKSWGRPISLIRG